MSTTESTTKIIIVLFVTGNRDHAMSVVDDLLEEGMLQDCINEHECDDGGPGHLHVDSASASFGEEPT